MKCTCPCRRVHGCCFRCQGRQERCCMQKGDKLLYATCLQSRGQQCEQSGQRRGTVRETKEAPRGPQGWGNGVGGSYKLYSLSAAVTSMPPRPSIWRQACCIGTPVNSPPRRGTSDGQGTLSARVPHLCYLCQRLPCRCNKQVTSSGYLPGVLLCRRQLNK